MSIKKYIYIFFKGSMPKLRNIQEIVINGFPAFTSGVIPLTNGDNITLTAGGYISKSQEVEQATMFWFRNGQRIYSPLSSLEHMLLTKSDYLNVSQNFSLFSGDFSGSGVYEVQLIVDARNSYYHDHFQCRPYYNTFVARSIRFGSRYIILSQAEIHLPYVG